MHCVFLQIYGRVTFRALGQADDAVQFVRVEQGHFDDGDWVVDRLVNGDQTFFGLRFPPSGAMYRASVRALAS